MANFFGQKRYARRYHKKGEMNKTEEEYSRHLEDLRLEGHIQEWKYEPETLKLGKDCRYTPDFRVFSNDGTIEFHEVKGRSKDKAYIEDDALVKIKTAAELHSLYKFVICWKARAGNWEKREIN